MNTSYTRHILIVGFLSVMLIIFTLSLFWYSNTSHIKQRLEDIRDRFEISKLIHSMSDASRLRAISAYRMALMDDVFDRFEEQDSFYIHAEMFLSARNNLLSHPAFNEHDKLAWNNIRDTVSKGGSLHTQIVNSLMEQDDQQAILLLKNKSKKIQNDFIREFNIILAQKNKDVDLIVKDAEATNDHYLALIIIIGAFSFIFLSVAFIFAFKYILKTEISLQRARDIEKSENEYKTEFLSRASHELRTPLNAILGFAQVINMDEENKLPKEHAMYFKHIEQSGWQLLSLVDDILDMTRIYEGSISLNIETVSLREALSNCFDSLATLAKSHNVVCSFKFEGMDIDKIEADKSRINQILQNLISNAIKYNISSGTVSIIVKESVGDMVRIEVHNTGKGIEKTKMAMLFKPFSRIDKIDKEDGRGIGLVLTKGLVECLNGRIGVESEPDVTTTFWIELPKIHIEATQLATLHKQSA